MPHPLFSLQEDLAALAELLPSTNVQNQLGSYLQLIQTAASREQLYKWLEQVSGYLQALDDLKMLSTQQAILLREVVTRAHMRCPLN